MLVDNDVDFRNAHLWFPDAVLLGYKDTRSGRLHINPKPSTKITRDMELIFFAEDDDTYEAVKPSVKMQKRWVEQQNISKNIRSAAGIENFADQKVSGNGRKR